jgi:hypothetical protein
MKVLFFENVSLTLRVRNRPMSVLYSPIASDVERSRNIQSRRDLMPVGENIECSVTCRRYAILRTYGTYKPIKF